MYILNRYNWQKAQREWHIFHFSRDYNDKNYDDEDDDDKNDDDDDNPKWP